jgi:CRISPR-associated protein Csm4
MVLYRIRVRLCSPLVTPLKGDTIWGHIVWGIANHGGDAEAFLEAEKSDDPPLVVSSAFPAGMICRPLPEPEERTEIMTEDRYARIKQNRKIKYVPASEFLDVPAGDKQDGEGLETAELMHNTIDRDSNTVQTGGVYVVTEQWPRITDWDLYVLSSFAPAKIVELFAWAFENGYGAYASTGKGKILVQGEPVPVKPKKKGTRRMALGPFVQNPARPVSDIRSDIFIRTGRIGGVFVSALTYYKKTVLLYDEGAVFSSKDSYVGRLLTNIHRDPRICQAAFAPAIPVGEK